MAHALANLSVPGGNDRWRVRRGHFASISRRSASARDHPDPAIGFPIRILWRPTGAVRAWAGGRHRPPPVDEIAPRRALRDSLLACQQTRNPAVSADTLHVQHEPDRRIPSAHCRRGATRAPRQDPHRRGVRRRPGTTHLHHPATPLSVRRHHQNRGQTGAARQLCRKYAPYKALRNSVTSRALVVRR